jgi:hypothetical protein
MGAINVSFISSEFFLSFIDNTKSIYTTIAASGATNQY